MAARRFENQIAIVTGGSSGIGRATALALAREGASITLVARNARALEQVALEIKTIGREALPIAVDLTQKSQVEQMVATTLARWRQIDILVANAGAYIRRPIAELQVEEIERSMAINFYAAFYCIRAVLPHMLARRRGHIVIVNTVDAKKALPRDAPYVAAKFALAGLGEVMRQELNGTGVYVTNVFPGRVDTPMIANLKVPRISAKLPAAVVANAIIRAIARKRAEVIVPPAARALIYLNMFAPRMADWAVRVLHLEGWEV